MYIGIGKAEFFGRGPGLYLQPRITIVLIPVFYALAATGPVTNDGGFSIIASIVYIPLPQPLESYYANGSREYTCTSRSTVVAIAPNMHSYRGWSHHHACLQGPA